MKTSTMTSTAKKSPATATSSATATLEASPVWSIMTSKHKLAIRALEWRSNQPGAVNGLIEVGSGLLVKFGVQQGAVRTLEDLEALMLIEPTGHGTYAETYRLTWLPTEGAPAGNEFMTVDIEAWKQARAARPLKPHEQIVIDSIATAKTRPDLLDETDVKLLDSIHAMVMNYGRPSERQVWAVNAIRNRVLRGEKRAAPAAPAPAATPAPAPAPAVTNKTTDGAALLRAEAIRRKALKAEAPAKASPTPIPTSLAPNKNAPVLMPVHAIVCHSMHGRGHVIIAEQGTSVVLFDYGQHVRVPNDRLKLVPADEDEGKFD
jgi:hypothetical protein